MVIKELVCLHCDKVFIAKLYPSTILKKKFCSVLCGNKYKAISSAIHRGNVQRYRGTKDTYTKLNGRHMHRVVVEEHIGRKLTYDEVVHHIDENKKNNDLSNLQIVTRQEHCKIHFTKPVRYCSIEECHNKYHCKTYCRVHYDKIIRKR